MTNDIASELSLLHTLKGAAYVSKLMEIAARKLFHPLEDDPCIFSVGGEKDADYPNLLNAARKAVEHGYQVYILPNPRGTRTADFIFVRRNIYKLFDLKTISGKTIVESQLDDLKAAVLQDDMVVKALSGSTTAETITQHPIPKVIRERYPDLTDGEIEEVRQRLLLDTIVKGNDIVNEKGEPISSIPNGNDEEQPSEGNRLIKIANRFINIDKLSINLIDTINPFQRAYEVVSKSVDAKTLKLIQDTIAEQKYDMTLEQAIILFKGPLKEYVAAHDGKLPSMDDPDPRVRELGVAYAKILNQKRRQLSGLEIGE